MDLAETSGVSRSVISRTDLGAIGRTRFESINDVCTALGADLDLRVRWRGERLDRLLDEAHAGLVDRFVRLLRDAGWEVAVEATFNVDGERGSVDILGWHAATATLLIGEIKSVIADAQGTLATASPQKSPRQTRSGLQRVNRPRSRAEVRY